MPNKEHPIIPYFKQLTEWFVLYDLSPNQFLRSFVCKEYPFIEATLRKAFEVYDNSILTELELNANYLQLADFWCQDVTKEKDLCLKQVRMLLQLNLYKIHHQEDLLDPNLWNHSPITAKYPEFSDFLDDDHLFDLAKAQIIDNDKVQYKSDLLFYHPGLSHHFRREFLSFCLNETNCDKKIALDPRRMVPAKRYPKRLLLDYWFGPQFNIEDIDDRIYGIQMTSHGRRQDSYLNSISPLDRTEFMWSMRNNLKTLQIEELVPTNIDKYQAIKRIAVRYIHSIRDTERQSFVHLDGAIRYYLPENYANRFHSKLTDHPNADGYYKLFRIDGMIPNQMWIDLIANYYSDNELIHEYFGQPIANL